MIGGTGIGIHSLSGRRSRVVSFCRQWGRILEWRYRKPLYDAAVTSFVESGHIGPKKAWRKHDVSDDQAALVAKLCDLLDEPPPRLETKGEAFEWIYARGGNLSAFQIIVDALRYRSWALALCQLFRCLA